MVLELLAEGSFGKVYSGKWRGADVAVKVIMLPGNMSGREKREKMVVWEAAISSSLIHPNVCQTYHYSIKPVRESSRSGLEMGDLGSAVVFSESEVSSSKPKSGFLTDSKGHNSGSSGAPEEVHSYEVQLVLEYCDRLSLRDALDAGMFMTPMGLNYAAQLECAMDVAKAMLHLHCHNILHLDLKTRNVLLASSGTEGKGVTCKVGAEGRITFGIVLWELFTCGAPFRGVPTALLGHSIVKDGKRPGWPPVVPTGYKDLANACWDQSPDARPSFEVILEELQKLRSGLGIPTPPLQHVPVQRPQRKHPQSQEDRGSPFSAPQVQCQASRSGPLVKGPSEVLLQAQPPTSMAVPEAGLTQGQDRGTPGRQALKAASAHDVKGEETSCSADLVHERVGQRQLRHPPPGTRERVVNSAILQPAINRRRRRAAPTLIKPQQQ
ncbi:kinase-like domain-containing protein [Dunaliella salina]|uniref:Kinase-like domain-containing protein n=1 Tax=Dunaliella salina TaxID=3046 RepID=A0ABQ7GRX9_DUNSA|nr:kinase-like domain-containing protein [Dunaliella salina]|eukprot:KAF5837371.1 kinase-like domain-containing protein [Dunaliella salina]